MPRHGLVWGRAHRVDLRALLDDEHGELAVLILGDGVDGRARLDRQRRRRDDENLAGEDVRHVRLERAVSVDDAAQAHGGVRLVDGDASRLGGCPTSERELRAPLEKAAGCAGAEGPARNLVSGGLRFAGASRKKCATKDETTRDFTRDSPSAVAGAGV